MHTATVSGSVQSRAQFTLVRRCVAERVGREITLVKNLTVHRNTIECRQRRNVQASMVRAAKTIGDSDTLAYAIVAIDADGTARCSWDTGSALPLWAFADTFRTILDRDIQASEVEDTWKPSLSERRRP